ncbi:hypothetical protein LEP1GSC188_0346 [Leptospira weilii serovar Topaz str. LT2116]|uniref:Uncharacterized protein n=1 Tax=Leptospira weilii serovar Topaz str. LT2116 TaxID=1088540 RepID=M3FQR2_9LEPT|nr:hypothetical protein LEP1GSC188_0346 [Leptospira weilii serovar Topaz str. LT2116]
METFFHSDHLPEQREINFAKMKIGFWYDQRILSLKNKQLKRQFSKSYSGKLIYYFSDLSFFH